MVHLKVRKETLVFNFSDFLFGTFNLFNRNKTVYKAVLCSSSTCGWLHFSTPQIHVKSLLADVHAIVSPLGGWWEILHLSATFSFPVDIKSHLGPAVSVRLLSCCSSVWTHPEPWPCSECLLTASCLIPGVEVEGWVCSVQGSTGPLSGQCGYLDRIRLDLTFLTR